MPETNRRTESRSAARAHRKERRGFRERTYHLRLLVLLLASRQP